jgi:hypothetical protein
MRFEQIYSFTYLTCPYTLHYDTLFRNAVRFYKYVHLQFSAYNSHGKI